jgi:hypothetical protein
MIGSGMFEANRERKAPRTPAIALATVRAKAAGVDDPAQSCREPLAASKGTGFAANTPSGRRVANKSFIGIIMPCEPP